MEGKGTAVEDRQKFQYKTQSYWLEEQSLGLSQPLWGKYLKGENQKEGALTSIYKPCPNLWLSPESRINKADSKPTS